MRRRLRRLLSVVRRPGTPATGPAPMTQVQAPPAPANPAQPSPAGDQAGRDETERRLEDARRRLKQAVPPRED